jgi:hypothetical protein
MGKRFFYVFTLLLFAPRIKGLVPDLVPELKTLLLIRSSNKEPRSIFEAYVGNHEGRPKGKGATEVTTSAARSKTKIRFLDRRKN